MELLNDYCSETNIILRRLSVKKVLADTTMVERLDPIVCEDGCYQSQYSLSTVQVRPINASHFKRKYCQNKTCGPVEK